MRTLLAAILLVPTLALAQDSAEPPAEVPAPQVPAPDLPAPTAPAPGQRPNPRLRDRQFRQRPGARGLSDRAGEDASRPAQLATARRSNNAAGSRPRQ